MNEIKYVNLENWELLTTKQLHDFYIQLVRDDVENSGSFNNYVNECTGKNGSLEEVEKFTDTFYRTKDCTCYSINEQMVCKNINSELSDFYFDNMAELDELALDLDIHTFEELIDNYAKRIDNFNFDEIQKQLCICIESNNAKPELVKLVQLMIDSTFFVC